MKNLLSILTLVTIVFFTSCTKEELIQPESFSETSIESVNQSISLPKSEGAEDTSNDPLNLTLEIEVTQISISSFAGELLVEFNSSYDFTDQVLENNQTLSFTDANNNDHNLGFTVNSFVGTNGNLQAVFDIGQHNLAGLDLKLIQSIIIADDIMN